MRRATHQWLSVAEDDLDAALAMLSTERYLYAAFMAQQATEKALKALIHESGRLPPRTHDLEALAGLAEVAGETWLPGLRRLSGYYIAARYPEEREKLKQVTTRAIADELLGTARSCCQWARTRLTSETS